MSKSVWYLAAELSDAGHVSVTHAIYKAAGDNYGGRSKQFRDALGIPLNIPYWFINASHPEPFDPTVRNAQVIALLLMELIEQDEAK